MGELLRNAASSDTDPNYSWSFELKTNVIQEEGT